MTLDPNFPHTAWGMLGIEVCALCVHVYVSLCVCVLGEGVLLSVEVFRRESESWVQVKIS